MGLDRGSAGADPCGGRLARLATAEPERPVSSTPTSHFATRHHAEGLADPAQANLPPTGRLANCTGPYRDPHER